MVQLALDAVNTATYQFNDGRKVALSSLVTVSSVALSSYSIRSGHIPGSALEPFLVNRKIDLARIRPALVAKNSAYFLSEDDIEDVIRWQKRDLIDTWVIKIFVSIAAYKRVLATR